MIGLGSQIAFGSVYGCEKEVLCKGTNVGLHVKLVASSVEVAAATAGKEDDAPPVDAGSSSTPWPIDVYELLCVQSQTTTTGQLAQSRCRHCGSQQHVSERQCGFCCLVGLRPFRLHLAPSLLVELKRSPQRLSQRIHGCVCATPGSGCHAFARGSPSRGSPFPASHAAEP